MSAVFGVAPREPEQLRSFPRHAVFPSEKRNLMAALGAGPIGGGLGLRALPSPPSQSLVPFAQCGGPRALGAVEQDSPGHGGWGGQVLPSIAALFLGILRCTLVFPPQRPWSPVCPQPVAPCRLRSPELVRPSRREWHRSVPATRDTPFSACDSQSWGDCALSPPPLLPLLCSELISRFLYSADTEPW